MNIKSISLKNYRGISNCKIDFHPKMNVIIGNNGIGKTSILDACALLLNRAVLIPQNNTKFTKKTDVKKNKVDYNLTLTIDTPLYGSGQHTVKYSNKSSKYIVDFLGSRKDLYKSIIEEKVRHNLPIIAYYKTNRAVIDIPLRIRIKHEFDQINGYDDSLAGSANFRLFFEWYRYQDDLSNRKYRQTKEWVNYLEPINEAIKSFTGFIDLKLSEKGNKLLLTKKASKQALDMDLLSHGEKIYIALIGDIARRLLMLNPSLTNPLEGEGVILIDEVELHLHPQWQHEILQKLMDTFPNCQFIVTTHSPQIITSVKDAYVYALNESIFLDTKDGDKDCLLLPQHSFYGKTSDQTLESVMESRKRNIEVEKIIKKIYNLLDESKFSAAKKELRVLRDTIDERDAIIKELETKIEILEL